MEEPRQQQTLRDEEATLVVGGEETTLVAPRFDDDETLVARPVVPLDADADAPAVPAPAPAAARPAREYRRPYAPRRSWMLALVLISVLVGGVLGGAGLYLYQRQSQDPAVSPAAATQPPAPAAAESQNATQPEAPAPQTDAPTAAAAPDAEEAAQPAPDEEAPAAAPAREPRNVPAADGAPKRGKKGDRDEEIERRATPRPDGGVARADQPEARQVDTIFYRQRRAERRAERRAARRARRADDDVDRLRRIFEGTPQ